MSEDGVAHAVEFELHVELSLRELVAGVVGLHGSLLRVDQGEPVAPLYDLRLLVRAVHEQDRGVRKVQEHLLGRLDLQDRLIPRPLHPPLHELLGELGWTLVEISVNEVAVGLTVVVRVSEQLLEVFLIRAGVELFLLQVDELM